MNKKIVVLIVIATVVLAAMLLASCRVEPWMCDFEVLPGCQPVPTFPNPYP